MNNKINAINKYFKKLKTNTLLELLFENHQGFNIYIRIEYFKKDNIYKLVWIDLDEADEKKIEHYINVELLSEYNTIEHLFITLEEINEDINLLSEKDIDGNIYMTIYKDKTYKLSFNRYIPIEYQDVYKMLLIIFDNMPKKTQIFYESAVSFFTGNNDVYDYIRTFNFDIEKDNYNVGFKKDVIKEALKLDVNTAVENIERFSDGTYLAMVFDDKVYNVSIKYDDNKKHAQMNCSCDAKHRCRHMIIAIEAIRKKIVRKYPKLVYKDPDSLYSTLFNQEILYFIEGNKKGDEFYAITNNYELVLVDMKVLGRNFIILEDVDDKALNFFKKG